MSSTRTMSVVLAALVFGALSAVGSFGSDFIASISYVGALGGAALAVLHTASLHSVHRRGWLLIGAGMSVWAVAGALVTIQGDGGVTAIPNLLISLLYVAGYPFMMVGLVLLAEPEPQARRLTNIIDGALLFTFLYGVLWLLIVEDIAFDSTLPSLDRAFSSMYPAGDLALVLLALRLVFSRAQRREVSLLLLIGTVASAAADFGLLALYLANPNGSWPITDFAYLCGAAMMAIAGLLSTGTATVAHEPSEAGTRRLSLFVAGFSIVPPIVLFLVIVKAHHAVRLVPIAVWLVVVAVLTVLRGIESVRALEDARKRVDWYATHDALTGLYVRAPFMDLASRGGMRERVGTVMAIDVDGFRGIVDKFGADAADAVLVEIGHRLQQSLGEGALVARLNHDTFAAFVRSSDLNRGRVLAEAVRWSMHEPIATDGRVIQATLSIGVAQADGAVIDLAAGLRRAIDAMRQAKALGPGRYLLDAELAGTIDPDAEPLTPRQANLRLQRIPARG